MPFPNLPACGGPSTMPSLLQRNYRIYYPPNVPKSEETLKFGILGAARIAPLGIILPAKTHPDVDIYAVAARDETKALAFAKKHGVPKMYYGSTGYQDLLDDPEIDVVYNPLPNGLHFEWSMRALAAGKHVLCEKPVCNTEDEAKRLFKFATDKNLILMEAFHYRFHPAMIRMKGIIDSGVFGRLKHVDAALAAPDVGIVGDDDIRFDYSLGGGAMMDVGTYTLSIARYLTSNDPSSVVSATPFLKDEKVDAGISAAFLFPNDVTASIYCHFRHPKAFGLIPLAKLSAKAELEGGTIELVNFPGPHFYHYVQITPTNGKSRTEKCYSFKSGQGKGEPHWSTYRYMLESFVDKLQGRLPRTWIEAEDSIQQMHWIDKVYEKADLPLRTNSSFTF